MATLQARIENYSGILGDSETWNGQNINLQADQWAVDAVKTLIGAISNTRVDLLPSFSGRSLTLTSAHSSIILDVFLNDGSNVYECSEITPKQKRQAADTNSILYAPTISPVYYMENNVITVLPNSGTATANLIAFDLAIDVSVDSTITNFPTEFEHLLVLFVASKILQWKMLYYTTLYSDITVSGNTEVNDAMVQLKDAFDRARDIVVDDAGHAGSTYVTDNVTNYSALYWLGEEDSEMVTSALNIAQAEMSVLNAAGTELSAVINKDTIAYNWLTSQQQAVMKEISTGRVRRKYNSKYI